MKMNLTTSEKNRGIVRFLLMSMLLCLLIHPAQAQDRVTVTGRLTDTSHAPLIGASVIEQGTTNGVTTDAEGNYQISVSGNATLGFSFIGYKPQNVAVMNRTAIDVTLEEDATMIGEVVAIGYGSQRKEDLSMAVTTVKLDEAAKSRASNLATILQGRMPGVTVQQTGDPMKPASFTIRGRGSKGNDDDPTSGDGVLVVVDGVPNAPLHDGGRRNDHRTQGCRLGGNLRSVGRFERCHPHHDEEGPERQAPRRRECLARFRESDQPAEHAHGGTIQRSVGKNRGEQSRQPASQRRQPRGISLGQRYPHRLAGRDFPDRFHAALRRNDLGRQREGTVHLLGILRQEGRRAAQHVQRKLQRQIADRLQTHQLAQDFGACVVRRIQRTGQRGHQPPGPDHGRRMVSARSLGLRDERGRDIRPRREGQPLLRRYEPRVGGRERHADALQPGSIPRKDAPQIPRAQNLLDDLDRNQAHLVADDQVRLHHRPAQQKSPTSSTPP